MNCESVTIGNECPSLMKRHLYSDVSTAPWLLTDQVLSWEGSFAQRAWRYLRTLLETHDTLESDWGYRKAVYRRILDLDRFSRVPAWLSKFFEEEQPEYLVRISLQYGLVREALMSCIDMLKRVRFPLLYFHAKSTGADAQLGKRSTLKCGTSTKLYSVSTPNFGGSSTCGC